MIRMVAVVLCVFLTLSGCNLSSGKAYHQNGKLYLPPNSDIVEYWDSQNYTHPGYEKFANVYPTNWPAGFTLPPDSYIENLPLTVSTAASPDSNAPVVRFSGVVRRSPDEVREHFLDQAANSGFTVEDDRHIDNSRFSAVDLPAPNYDLYSLSLRKRGCYVVVKIDFEDDLDGYTMFSGSLVLE